MNYLKITIEFFIIFFFVYIIYYFFVVRKCKKNENHVPMEVGLILSIHNIDPKKINLYQMVKVVSLITVIVLSIVITMVSESFNNFYLAILIGSIMSILIALVSYRIIGNHYERKCQENTKIENSKKKKSK